MEDRVVQLESRVAYLTDHLADLERRLAGLEGQVPAPAEEPPDSDSLAAIVGLQGPPVQQWLGLAGRTLVVLGGA
jgi:transposase